MVTCVVPPNVSTVTHCTDIIFSTGCFTRPWIVKRCVVIILAPLGLSIGTDTVFINQYWIKHFSYKDLNSSKKKILDQRKKRRKGNGNKIICFRFQKVLAGFYTQPIWVLQDLDTDTIVLLLQLGNCGSQKLDKSYGIWYLGREWKDLISGLPDSKSKSLCHSTHVIVNFLCQIDLDKRDPPNTWHSWISWVCLQGCSRK